MWVCRSIFTARNGRDAARRRPLRTCASWAGECCASGRLGPAFTKGYGPAGNRPYLKRLDWLGLFHLGAALFAGAPRIVVPEIEHGLAEMLDDIAAVKMNVFH
jgi:hypothetical protein